VIVARKLLGMAVASTLKKRSLALLNKTVAAANQLEE
jgi:hypothetical protein